MRRNFRSPHLLVRAVVPAGIGLSCLMSSVSAASAQQSPTSTPSTPSVQRGSEIEELIVTARRREENLEKSPVSASVLSQDALAAREIRTESDLQTAVPGLLTAQGISRNQFTFTIRGQSVDAFSGSQSGVFSYINEVPLEALAFPI